MKMKYICIASLLVLCGCGMIPISDGQIEDIANAVGGVTGAITAPVANSFFPGAGPGAAGLVGGFLTLVTAAGLKLLQKKSALKRQTEILEVTKKVKK